MGYKVLDKLKNLLNNKQVKTLLGNFVSLAALQLIGMLLALITLPYLLRVLGFKNYGIVVLAGTLVAYFKSVVDYSFRITATRDVSVFRDSPQKLNIIYSKVVTIKTILLIISFLFIALIVLLYPPFYEEKLVFFLTSLLLLGYTLFPEWYFQGIEKMKYISILNISIKVFFTVGIFVFVKEKEDYWIYALLQSIGMIGAGIAGQYILIKKYKVKFVWLGQKTLKKSFTNNFPIFINQFFPTLYNNTSSFLLGILGGTVALGLYDALKKIIDLAVVLLDAVSRVFFPFLNRRKDMFANYRKIMLTLSISIALGLIICSQLIFWYLNITMANAFYVLMILSISIVGYALYDIYGLNYFIVHRKDKVVMKNTVMSSVIGFMTAFPLISFFGVLGAAINLSMTRWLMGGLLMIKAKYDKDGKRTL